jgi:polyketide synthase PksL
MARYRNELVKQRARSGRTLAIRWQRQEEEIDAAAQSALFIDALSAINIMDMGLQSEPEATTFVATSDPHEPFEVSQSPQATSAHDGQICGQIYGRILAFEKGEMSRDAFVDYLGTLQVDALTQIVQKRIVQAIERFERGITPAQPVASPPALERILANVEKVLGLKAHAIDCDKPFQDYGLDSILAVKLSSALEKEFGCPVSPAWLVEHSTVNALTDRLSRDLNELETTA